MSQIANILKAALEQATGEEVHKVWYEPIKGPCMEMQGYAGGWMYEGLDGMEDVIGGYTAEDAIRAIVVKGQLVAMSEVSKAKS